MKSVKSTMKIYELDWLLVVYSLGNLFFEHRWKVRNQQWITSHCWCQMYPTITGYKVFLKKSQGCYPGSNPNLRSDSQWLQHDVIVAWCDCNMMWLQHDVIATWSVYNMIWLQHDLIATWPDCNMIWLQHDPIALTLRLLADTEYKRCQQCRLKLNGIPMQSDHGLHCLLCTCISTFFPKRDEW
jgi:hypothetical protein